MVLSQRREGIAKQEPAVETPALFLDLQRILLVRRQKVMLDFDLAELYGVETRRLVEQVKRNSDRFPEDFMFQLTKEELENWRSQFAMSNPGVKMGLCRPPYAFTEIEYLPIV